MGDFLTVGNDETINAATDVIKNRWKVSEKDTLNYGSGLSVEYLSVNVQALPQGFFLSQAVYTTDLLEKWSMAERKPIGSLDDVEVDSDAGEDEAEAGGEPQTLQ